MNNQAGGFLVGRKDGKIILHNDASLGGFLVGKRHSEGGIDGINVNTGQSIEVEVAEVQINDKAVKSEEKREFEGEMLTNREILSRLNQDGGGVAFKNGGNVEEEYKTSPNVVDKGAGKPIEYKGGEAILTRGAVSNPKKYTFEGKELTTREIASKINEEAGGVAFATGGDVPDKIKCPCSHYEIGGQTHTLQSFIQMSESDYNSKRLADGILKERNAHYLTLAKLSLGEITIEQALGQIALKRMITEPNYPY